MISTILGKYNNFISVFYSILVKTTFKIIIYFKSFEKTYDVSSFP